MTVRPTTTMAKTTPAGACSESRRWTLAPLNEGFAGERLGLVGPHGAGKTTLLRLLAGTLLPSSGDIAGGRACLLNDYQTPFLPDAPLRRNFALIAQIQRVKPAALLDQLGEIEAIAGPLKLDAPAGSYSRIEYARIGVAAALACAPDLILADNALGPPDPDFREALEEKIVALCEAGAVVVFAPKKLAHLSFCRRALWLDNGALIQDAAAADVAEAYVAMLADEELDEQGKRPTSPPARPNGANGEMSQRMRRMLGQPARATPKAAPAMCCCSQRATRRDWKRPNFRPDPFCFASTLTLGLLTKLSTCKSSSCTRAS